MARRPEDRYASAGELRAALLAAVAVPDEPTIPPGVLDPAARNPYPPTPPVPDPGEGEPPPTFVQSERRWLVPTLLIVLVAVALGVAGVLLGRSDPGKLLDNVTGRTTDPPAAAAKLVSAKAFDPLGDGQEDDSQTSRVIDGDRSTSWQTEHYNTPIEQQKAGVGIYVTLDKATTISKLKLASGSSGWDAEIYVVDGPPGSDLASWGKRVGRKSNIGTGETTIDLTPKKGTSVLVWITHLSDQDGTHEVVIDEITPQS